MNAPTSPDPIEIAMQAVGGAGPAETLLVNQNRLVGWQIARERAGFWLRVLMGLGGLAATALVGLAMWNASQARGIVIDAIEAPPHLVAQGYTGKALAAQLQDGLLRLDELIQTRERIAEVRESDRGVKIDIPNTGVSIDQVDKFLRGWLGHETVVSGELVDIKDGPEAGALALVLRQTGKPAQRVVSKERNVAALIQAGAERMYGAQYSGRFLNWLRDHGRAADAAALAREYATWRWYVARGAGLSSIAGEPETPARQGLAMRWEAASVFGDRSWSGWGQLARVEEQFGHVEHALLARRRAVHDDRRSTRALSPQGLRFLLDTNISGMALAVSDVRPLLTYVCGQFSVEPCSPEAIVAAVRVRGNLGSVPQTALALARAHDPALAARLLATSPTGNPQIRLTAEAQIAVERQDWASVLTLADRSDALARQMPNADVPNRAAIWRPLALAKLGRPPVDQPPLAECYDCLIAAAMAAAARSDTAEAERLFTAAERQGPSYHRAQLEHARARLARGDAAGAIALVRPFAAQPGQADALFIWGQALAAQGDTRSARVKFQAAARMAPWWADAVAKAAR